MKNFLLIIIFFMMSLLCNLSLGEVSPQKTYVVANSKSKDSMELANYYAEKRNIAKENIIALDMPDSTSIKRNEYHNLIETPLIKSLISKKAISAIEISKDSKTHKTNFLFSSHNIDFIVLCFTPYAIEDFETKQNSMKSNAASVDSELSAVFLPMKSLNGFCKNPLYDNYSPDALMRTSGVLRVSRLDGENLNQAKDVLESALNAETKGLRGRAYIDKAKKFKQGDAWLDDAAATLNRMGFDTSVNEIERLFFYDERIDAPAFYFGWYSERPFYYMNEKDFRLQDGAISLHIYSFSAFTLRSYGWVHSLIKMRTAQTFGNINEPFLSATHNISKLMKAYENGLTAGEAAFASIPVLSWQNIVIGDPLYNPFKISLEKQLSNIDAGDIDNLSQYSVIRKMNLLINDNSIKEAIAFGEKYVDRIPDTALIFKIIKEYKKLGNINAMQALIAKIEDRNFCNNIETRGLGMEFAKFLSENSKPLKAMEIYESMLPYANDRDFKFLLWSYACNLSNSGLAKLSEKFKKLGEELDKQKN